MAVFYFCGCFIKCTCLDAISKLVRPTTLSLCGKFLVLPTQKGTAYCMEHLVMQRQLRWVGHVIRMQSNRLPRRTLFRVTAWKARHWRSEETLLRSCQGNPVEVRSSSWSAGGTGGRQCLQLIRRNCASCVRRAWQPSTSTMTRRQKLVAPVDTRSQAHLRLDRCIAHLWLQNLRIRVWAAESSLLSSPITDQLAQRHRRPRRTPASKHASKLHSRQLWVVSC